jgi:hypothetical protein
LTSKSLTLLATKSSFLPSCTLPSCPSGCFALIMSACMMQFLVSISFSCFCTVRSSCMICALCLCICSVSSLTVRYIFSVRMARSLSSLSC